jgi:hypothetical protein
MIAILGSAPDPQVLRVQHELEALGALHHLIDTGRFPEEAPLGLSPDGVHSEGRSIPRPRAAYIRGLACHPLRPSLAGILAEHPRRVIAAMEEKRALLESLLLSWGAQGTRLFNPPESNAQHSRKPWQLQILQQAGLPVPAWIATSDPDALRAWMDSHPQAVYKPLAGGATVRMVTPEDLAPERLEQLQAAPVLFQQYIEGTSIRVYVVEGRVVAAGEIRSQHLDYRRGEDAVLPATLRADEEAMATKAAEATGMPFTGVDLIRSTTRTWILEANPSPMFAVFEEKTGLNIAAPLAQALSTS